MCVPLEKQAVGRNTLTIVYNPLLLDITIVIVTIKFIQIMCGLNSYLLNYLKFKIMLFI